MYLQAGVPLRALIRSAFTRGNSRIVLAKLFLTEWPGILKVVREEGKFKECADENFKDDGIIDYRKEMDLAQVLARE